MMVVADDLDLFGTASEEAPAVIAEDDSTGAGVL